MDDRIFLRDIDDDELLVRGLESYVLEWREVANDLRKDLFAVELSEEGSDLQRTYMAKLDLRLKSLEFSLHVVVQDLVERKRRLRNRENSLTDVELDEETP